ncbi:MAG: bifunctional oligoribonuclease/PAP phosphatase NrnA [Desulfobacterales bacterium]|jgi:phosphoesterase RecJ-like protein|nr:bifunctional oligoribonuclease/PAP phosphatase NrnA [Desulfobacterales bacterium]MDP6684285.1 bifunctional oligoribonuclease/PAP phosphatase NrnA [Desulfobacterales bacterium]MDP6808143.1 bifunctional oligoribonuclease/PAP phosphatase NrnA [Desulfobacterales bacterium]|tara:strand:+ start:24098 stop:25069 length:972 start_codon:yes stop_codon:yes gene_type:complete
MNQIINLLKNSNHILIASHANPDGDAIGALIAMGVSLDALNNKTTLYNESPIPAIYRFLPTVDRIVRHIDDQNLFDTAVILDCGDLERVGNALSTISRIPHIINIDHHVTNTRFGEFNLIDPSACATSEIVYRLIRRMEAAINLATATSIYTGILTDTGSFRFSNTNKAAFDICAEMVALGVEPYSIAQLVYGTYSLGRIKLLNLALDSIEISKNRKLSMMAVTQEMLNETGTKPEDIDGFINYAKGIEDVQVAVLIQELFNDKKEVQSHEHFHVSLRSNGTVNVAEIASTFGGGGHSNAAGFSIESTLAHLKSRVDKLAETL